MNFYTAQTVADALEQHVESRNLVRISKSLSSTHGTGAVELNANSEVNSTILDKNAMGSVVQSSLCTTTETPPLGA